ncbi:uncharacterized protein LOC134191817 [Corticium candelabrum]|uniref:uncharacterized protein LOC134191817 n=1 Tax=Corticium candelabrum TaxID=121492 RepID=UPI002E267840|nr:uncharacterized protein LOC134191817 [Corticium candelabrum]
MSFLADELGLDSGVQQLKSQLAEEMKHVKKVKELYQEEVQNLRRKMEQSAQVLRTAQQENKQVQRDYEKKVSHTEARVISLEAELGRKAMESRMAETENVSLKARLEHMSRDLDASLKARGNFEKAIDLEKEKWHKEYASVRDELHCQREKMVTLLAELTEAKANIQALEEEGESVHSSLVCERQANVDVQLQLNEALEEKSATSQQILFLTEEKVSMSSEITQLKQTVEEEQKQSAALRQHLQEAISQVQEEHRVSLTAQSKFNLLLGSLQAEFENDRKTLETERNNLMQQLHGASAELESLQNLVQQAGRKLKAANEELRETTRKKAEALELLEREISLRTELQQQASELGSQVTRCELEMNAMSETVTVTKATNHELQLKLDCAERKCHSLAEQLNEEKAASTMSKAAMGEQHRQLITELETRLMQANSQLGQMDDNIS